MHSYMAFKGGGSLVGYGGLHQWNLCECHSGLDSRLACDDGKVDEPTLQRLPWSSCACSH